MHTINLVGKRLLVIRNRKKHSDNEVSNNYFESPTQTDHNSRRYDVHKLSLFCLVALAVEDSRKPLLPETYGN